jgi:choline dehydrogenase-like flavoprotein
MTQATSTVCNPAAAEPSDGLVIGAGPAGSTTAALLARRRNLRAVGLLQGEGVAVEAR